MTQTSDTTQAVLARWRERNEKAHQMVVDLCKPRGATGKREWLMSIPARPDYDPDLVIGDALDDGMRLLDALEVANEALDDIYGTATTRQEAWDIADMALAAIDTALERGRE